MPSKTEKTKACNLSQVTGFIHLQTTIFTTNNNIYYKQQSLSQTPIFLLESLILERLGQ